MKHLLLSLSLLGVLSLGAQKRGHIRAEGKLPDAQSMQIATFEREYRYQRTDGREACIWLQSTSDSTSVLQYWQGDSLSSEWPIDCPVFQFQCADLTADSIPEIALGVERASRYARYTSRRLWLLKLYDEDVIRPLWLSSRLTYNLINFQLEPPSDAHPHKAWVIHTWQQTEQGENVELWYRQKGFGVKNIP